MKRLQKLITVKMAVMPPLNFFGPNIVALTTTEHAGDMGINNGNQVTTSANRLKIFTDIGKDATRVFYISPMHDADVKFISAAKLKKTDRVEADAIITERQERLTLALTHADRYPIFLADSTQEIIGLIHAGRQPIQRGVINNTLSLLLKCECQLKNIKIFFGPGICQKCYLFNEEMVRVELQNNGWEKFICRIPQPPGRKINFYKVNLLGRALKQLQEFTGDHGQKLLPKNILAHPQCNFEGHFFSHRKSMGSGVEPRNLSLITFTNK